MKHPLPKTTANVLGGLAATAILLTAAPASAGVVADTAEAKEAREAAASFHTSVRLAETEDGFARYDLSAVVRERGADRTLTVAVIAADCRYGADHPVWGREVTCERRRAYTARVPDLTRDEANIREQLLSHADADVTAAAEVRSYDGDDLWGEVVGETTVTIEATWEAVGDPEVRPSGRCSVRRSRDAHSTATVTIGEMELPVRFDGSSVISERVETC